MNYAPAITHTEGLPKHVPDMPFPEYAALRYINASALCEVAERSCMHARYRLDHGVDTSEAKEFGVAVHAAILEPERYAECFAVAPDVDRRTRAGKEQYAAWRAQNPGVVELDDDEAARIEGIRAAVRGHRLARTLTSVAGHREITLLWSREGWGCKARLDKLAWPNADTGLIIDLKSTRNAEPSAFARDAIRLGYHRKAAWYIDAVKQVYGKPACFVMIAVESEPPHGVSVHDFADEALRCGAAEMDAAFGRYALCLRNGSFVGYPECVNTIDAPAWLMARCGVE